MSAPANEVSTYVIVVRGPRGSASSAPVSIRMQFAPVAPQQISAEVDDRTVLVSWGSPSGTVDRIEVHRSDRGLIAVLAQSERSFRDASLPVGSRVVYEVKFLGPLGSASAPPVEAVVLTAASAPTAVEAETGPGRVLLRWAAPLRIGDQPVEVYEVSVLVDKKLVRRVTTTGTEVTISGLPRNTTVDYEIVAITAAGRGDSLVGSVRIPRTGYWMLGEDGSVYAFGEGRNRTPATVLETIAAGARRNDRAVSLAISPTGAGVAVLFESGEVAVVGDMADYGDAFGVVRDAGERPAAISVTPDGQGYWIFTDRGRVITRGSALFFDDLYSLTDAASGQPVGRLLNGPIIASVATPTGLGYYMVASDGGVFAFGDARFHGSLGSLRLNQPVVGLAPTPANDGYWLVGADGGVFAFGGAGFAGSLPEVLGSAPLNAPVNGLVPSGSGYLMSASDGGVFTFGPDVDYAGSLGGLFLPAPIVDIPALR